MKLWYGGGGITSKSLSEIPDNIKSMISKNYKKIAMGNFNAKTRENGHSTSLTFPKPSINFKYTKLYVWVYICLDSSYKKVFSPMVVEVGRTYKNLYDIYANSDIRIDENDEVLSLVFVSNQGRYILVDEWLAIE